LPPYSPELNPIEMLWSVLKAWVRKIAPRTLGRVKEAVERAWAKVTRDLCRSWISHSGYPVLSS
jgi:transposase